MRKKLTRTGNSVAVVLDRPILEQMGLTENNEVEISTNGDVVVITPVRDATRARKFRKSVETITEQYAGLFRRLSK